jgi:predicted short-subunit dehydrogenase-like oxidoreductase (DUF2520 family)
LKRTDTVFKFRIIESTDSYNIVMIGAGNVATHISRHLHSAGHTIDCIFSRNRESAESLAAEVGSRATSNPEELARKANFYIICVPDQAVAEVAARFQGWEGIWLHTAASVSLDVFQGITEEFGVLYPLQTLSRDRKIRKGQIPFLVEASSAAVLEKTMNLALSISGRVEKADFQSRLKLHLAAVFANNFSNHMVNIAQQILEAAKFNPTMLGPLLEETFQKLKDLDAQDAQTGPAVRGDLETMNKHRELLKDHPEWEKLYTFISREIERSRE